jgi:inositol phosphorylceramide mannosyltransferase catalytic subunit
MAVLLIPRIFHQIWVGPDPLPGEYAGYQQTWPELNPAWELRFWTDDNLPEGLLRSEVYDRSRTPWERADILRLEVVLRYGGVHVDADFECLRPIEPLLGGVELFIGFRKPGRVNGALFGAVAGHPIIEEGLARIPPLEQKGYDKDATGPKFLDDLLGNRPDVTYFEPGVFYPRTPDELDAAYATHHRARGWKDEEGLRRSLAKAEKRLFEAQQEAREWRLKYEQAAAELARLAPERPRPERPEHVADALPGEPPDGEAP